MLNLEILRHFPDFFSFGKMCYSSQKVCLQPNAVGNDSGPPMIC